MTSIADFIKETLDECEVTDPHVRGSIIAREAKGWEQECQKEAGKWRVRALFCAGTALAALIGAVATSQTPHSNGALPLVCLAVVVVAMIGGDFCLSMRGSYQDGVTEARSITEARGLE